MQLRLPFRDRDLWFCCENERNGPGDVRQQVMQQVQMWPFVFMGGVIREVGLCAKWFVWELRWDACGADIWTTLKGHAVVIAGWRG
jgi:hypothetical protein